MNARTFTISRVEPAVQNRFTRRSVAAIKQRRRARLEYLKFRDDYEAYCHEHQGDEVDNWETRSAAEVYQDLCRDENRLY